MMPGAVMVEGVAVDTAKEPEARVALYEPTEPAVPVICPKITADTEAPALA